MRAGRWMRAAACGLFFLCFALARGAAWELEAQDLDGLRLLVMDRELTGQDGIDMREREQLRERPSAFVLWGQRDSVTVENRDLNRFASCGKIVLWGNARLLLGATASLEENDQDGCLIDRSTAIALFGVPAPVGSRVDLGGEQRVVRGVLETDRPLVVLPAASRDAGLDHLTLRTPEGEHPRLTAEDFAARNGLTGVWSQPQTLAVLGRWLSLLPVLVLLLGEVLRNIWAAFSPEGGRGRLWLCIALAGAMWFLLLWLTEFRFQLPEEMIPNRWSDFDFWGRLFAEKREELLQALSSEKTVPELELLLPALQAAGLGVLAALLAPLLPRPASPAELWVCCAGGALMAFAASVCLSPGLAHDRALWLTLPVVFGGRWLLSVFSGGVFRGQLWRRVLRKLDFAVQRERVE